MRITVLGCQGLYPGPEGGTSGYLVEAAGKTLLIDCGSAVFSRLIARMDPCQLDAVVITHWHLDHVADLLPLRYCLMVRGATLPLYAPPVPDAFRELLGDREFSFYPLKMGFSLGNLTVDTCLTHHPVETYAVSVFDGSSRFVFSADTSVSEALVPFAMGCDLLLADAAMLDRDWTPQSLHLSARKAAEWAQASAVKALCLTHCPPFVDPQHVLKEARAVYPQAEMAAIGRVITC